MKRLFTRRGAAVVCVLVLLIFTVRPGAQRLRGRVSHSMAQALGRNVEIGSVHLRFLPRLGFELGNVVIHDDPAFGMEPLLRAPEVTAWLSIGGLLKGKIAIARLTVSYASLNLTRDSQGRWNAEDLIERTSRSALAPTGSGMKRRRQTFPYIEATHARINFKSGMEKTHFAFADSEFALWQESEDTWGARLKATPIRTDANLTDSGVVKLEGLWRRAAQADETPLQFSFEWKQAQVGQLSTLVYGDNKGWRGGLTVSGAVLGRPEHLKITADGSIDGMRRQDVLAGEELRIAAHCGAEYSSPTRSLTNVDCVAPSGAGAIELKGSAVLGHSASSPLSSYDLWLVADRVSAEAALNALRHANPSVPDEFSADGELSATLQIRKSDTQPLWFDGHGSAEQLELSSANAGNVVFGTVPFSFVSGATEVASHASLRSRVARRPVKDTVRESGTADEPRIEIGPVNLALSKASVLEARAALWVAGYEASLRGEAGIKRLIQLSRVLGIPSPTFAADGSAAVNLGISGSWDGERPVVQGRAQLRNARAQIRGLNVPLEIAAADLSINRDEVKVQSVVASTGGVSWRGSLEIPRPCRGPAACPFQFALRTPELSALQFNRLVNPAMAEKAWYSFLSLGSGQQPFLLQTHATGTVGIDKLQFGAASCRHFTADVQLRAGEVTLSNIRGDILGGHASGKWSADFAAKPPKYQANGILEDVSLSELADLMHDGWINGSGTIDYRLNAAGWGLQDVLSSADIDANFALVNGIFSHVVLPGASGPLRADNFSGDLHLQNGQFTLHDAKLKSSRSVYTVSGTASLNGALSLKIAGDTAPGYNVLGTLMKTRVTSIPVAQAALKP